ncbi:MULTISPECIES: DUF2845 domain-containing protein [Legionella]|uniref:DUF2845 domain-containing protein n=1 Tax=Legionella maceachernii TaxID=466 RepID=A0A0W0VVZ4_9GAMM|nr:DUF2845 domain-containing protein [Legionella maceachernii]KTD24484.1 hypothetical protein Lmac_2571 [Legionella maceachernii]SJZ60202.1 Protein of unknown function [Legionella maceachernii]SUP00827.1 Protein of uncharacterised function (DUF2845) [Legionella maceachernii]
MSSRLVITVGIVSFSMNAMASVQSYYCPQNQGYINVGMTPDQVIAACGQPLSQQQSNQPVMQKVPVQQLMYNNAGSPTAFYGVWSIPTGTSGGAQLQVNIVDNKVQSVNINGSGTNAFSVCGGTSIQVGDPASKVYGACGSPSVVNNSYINQPIQSNQKPQIWIYQPGEYQSPITLTFVNGKLQSID